MPSKKRVTTTYLGLFTDISIKPFNMTHASYFHQVQISQCFTYVTGAVFMRIEDVTCAKGCVVNAVNLSNGSGCQFDDDDLILYMKQ